MNKGGIKKQKLQRSKLTFEALNETKFVDLWLFLTKLQPLESDNRNELPHFLEDSVGNPVMSWIQYHGYMKIKNLKNTYG